MIADLMERGLLVYRKPLNAGPADLLVYFQEEDRCVLIDVKRTETRYRRDDGSIAYAYDKSVKTKKGAFIARVFGSEIIYSPELSAELGLV